jgi:hypothetical protein
MNKHKKFPLPPRSALAAVATFSVISSCEKRALNLSLTDHPSSQPPIHVYVLTLDGLGYDLLNAIPEGKTFIESNNVKRLIPPIPAVTFPSHASMIFGVDPELHGVLKNFSTPSAFAAPNHTIDPRHGSPSWQNLAAHNVKLQISGLDTLNSLGDIPALPINYGAEVDEKIDYIVRTESEDSTHAYAKISFVWNEGTDKAGHAYGPYDPESQDRLRTLLAKLNAVKIKLQNLPENVKAKNVFVFASDHGMAKIKTCTPYLSKRDSVDFSHGASYVLLKTERAVTEATALKATKLPEATIKLFNNPDLAIRGVLLLPEGYKFNNAGESCTIFAKGNHEFDPIKYPSQHGVLWSWSPDIALKDLQNIPNQDLLNLIAPIFN